MAKRYAVRLRKYNQDHEADGRFGGPGTSHQPTGNPRGRPATGAPSQQGGGLSTGKVIGSAGITAGAGIAGGIAGEIGGGLLGSALGPPGAVLGGVGGQFVGQVLGGLIGDTLGTKIGNSLLGLKEKADQHGVGLGATIGSEAASVGAYGLSRLLPGGSAIRPLFDMLPHLDEVGAGGVTAARLAQGGVEAAGGLAGGQIQNQMNRGASGGRRVAHGVRAGLKAGKMAAVGGLEKGRKVQPLFAKHFLDKPPAAYQSQGDSAGTFTSMYASALPNLFGPKNWASIKGTPFGGYIRQRIKNIAQKMDDAAEGNGIDLKPADPMSVDLARQSLQMKQQDAMQQQQEQDVRMAQAQGGQPAGGSPFGKARDTSKERRDKKGRWAAGAARGREIVNTAVTAGGGAAFVGGGKAAYDLAGHVRAKEHRHKENVRQATVDAQNQEDKLRERHAEHSALYDHYVGEAGHATQRLFEEDDPKTRATAVEHVEASMRQARFHRGRKGFYEHAIGRAKARAARQAATVPPGSKIYTAARAVRGFFHTPIPAATKVAGFLLRKAETLPMRSPNDVVSRDAYQTGGIANAHFLQRMQESDRKSRQVALTRALAQPKVENLAQAPGEDERMYSDRMQRVMAASVKMTDRLRPQLFNGGASEAGLGGLPPNKQRYKVTMKKAGLRKGGEWVLSTEIAKEFNTPGSLEKGLVYGWASVIEKDGQIVTDHEGDRIEIDELTQAAHNFISKSRNGGILHDESGHHIGHIVESVVFSKELQKALGIDLGKVGWLVGYQIVDPRVKMLAKSGMLKAFSIGGKGKRVPVL